MQEGRAQKYHFPHNTGVPGEPGFLLPACRARGPLLQSPSWNRQEKDHPLGPKTSHLTLCEAKRHCPLP